MRHRLRVLLVGSAIALAVSVVTMTAYALSTGSSGSTSARTNAARPTAASARQPQIASSVEPRTFSGPVTDSEVCGMLTSGEVYQLLNYQSALPDSGAPAPIVRGGACNWGTGQGEAFEVTVAPRAAGAGTHPCAGIEGTEVRSSGWVGCSRLEFVNDNVLRAFKGSYVVSIEPEVNVVGYPYLMAEESTITHVFRELGT